MSLVLENVWRTVEGEVHLADIDLSFESGRLYALLGPTLAGKTTLMRIMAGLERPNRGRLVEEGEEITGRPVRKRSVAMVYQQFVNYPSLTVYENIASPLRVAGLPAEEIDRQVRRTAGMLHIDGLLDRMPEELSGGQQQRCAIARALVKEARLLLLDEPLVNLDYKLREELRIELRELFQGRETIVVYATTEPLEALMMAGEVVVLHEGRVLQAGDAAEVYHRPATVAVSQVYSDPPMNLLQVTVQEGVARAGSFALPLSGHLRDLGEGVHLIGIRAAHLSVEPRFPEAISIEGRVVLAELSGSETFIYLRHNDVDWVVQEEGVHDFTLGEPLTIYLNPRRIYAFDQHGRLEAAPPFRPGER